LVITLKLSIFDFHKMTIK